VDEVEPSANKFIDVAADADPSRVTSGTISESAGAAFTSWVASTEVIAKLETNFISTDMDNHLFQGYSV